MPTSSILLLMCSAFMAASGQLLFKIGAQGKIQFLEFLNLHIATGFCFYFLSAAIWIYTLSFEKLVNVFAFTALTFVLVYAGGVFLLGESMNMAAATGVLFVLLGLYLITAFGSA
jgi:drug/metabolite transporter (DMT)-like permease